MRFKRERSFLGSLCKGYILDLVDEVGWSPIQCAVVKKKYLEFKSMPEICLDIGISESQYTRVLNGVCEKFQSFIVRDKNAEISKLFESFS